MIREESFCLFIGKSERPAFAHIGFLIKTPRPEFLIDLNQEHMAEKREVRPKWPDRTSGTGRSWCVGWIQDAGVLLVWLTGPNVSWGSSANILNIAQTPGKAFTGSNAPRNHGKIASLVLFLSWTGGNV